MFFVVMFARGVGENREVNHMNFKTKNEILEAVLTTERTLSEYYSTASSKILAEMEDFNGKGSNWTLKRIKCLEVRVNHYVPLGGSSYIDLPEKLMRKKAVLNVKNHDNKCFLWAVLAGLHPVNHNMNRTSSYKQFEHEFDDALQGIEFPMKLEQIAMFERRSGVSVNVYGFDENYIVSPLVITNNERPDRHVDLLFVKNDTTTHYCCINSLSRLVRTQITRHHSKIWLCKRCLSSFYTEDNLLKHKLDCAEMDAVRLTLPQPDKAYIKFKDYRCSMKVPYVVYADFESLLHTLPTVTPSDSSYTVKHQHHRAISFSYYVVRTDRAQQLPPVVYFGEDAANEFVCRLEKEAVKINWAYKSAIPMEQLTPTQQASFNETTTCHICGEELGNDRVMDHDHLTGSYRGAAHNECNLNFKLPTFLPIFIHNLSGYDTHLFIKAFSGSDRVISIIPTNEERYISFTVKLKNGINLRFLDSFRFLARGLEELVNNLTRDQLIHTAQHVTHLDLVCRKGVYPYEYMDSVEKYDQQSLPCQAAFYSRLTKQSITEEDYEHARKVWDCFGIRNLKEYTLLYNKTDVLLLADVMETFRAVCIKTYRLDPAWYYTAPGLAWSAMLKLTQVKLELFTDVDQLLMVERALRGGVSVCTNRYKKANNRYMKGYDSSKPDTYLMYLDANNLYGWAMSQCMPYGEFRWMVNNDVDVLNHPDDADTGYFVEVDLEYPNDLHDVHSDLPLAPEHRVPPGGKEKKLLTTLYNKERYVLHYRNLKLYVSLGMRVTRVHRILSFKQSPWLKRYIDLNTDMRTKAKNNFEKEFFKLMNNSVFGKTMENIRQHVDIRLVTKKNRALSLIAKPNFKHRTIFDEDLIAVHMRKTHLVYNKPVYIGASVLDVSKTLIYEFHYNVMRDKYGENLTLMYTDTDSLVYHITTEDVYADMKLMLEHFDTSDYVMEDMPKQNKKVVGKMKDELNGRVMREFVGLRSKMYAFEVDDGKTTKKAKGVKANVVNRELSIEDYKQCLLHNDEIFKTMNTIRSYKHELYTVEVKKKALCNKDDKRFILDDGISTLPWGHNTITLT